MSWSRRLAALALAMASLAVQSAASKAEKLGYNRDIRPLLAENCFRCHGADSAARKAGLRLDQRAAAMKAAVLAPGRPGDSELVRRIFSDDADDLMPPPSMHKTLTLEQKARLRQWIAEGAEYQPHWSFIAPSRPQPPTAPDLAWVRTPIDNFVLAKLREHGLTPAPEADRRTLARRVSLDLRGLPPTPAEVEALVNDPAPDAYEKFVDRLLQSPQWGEHRAHYWLDAARYADTHGLHFDNYREIWAYRDWVISAFNRNMPFDQFSVEQLAGDLLPNPSLEQRIATGLNRSNTTTNEGGAIDEEYLVLYARDRTETTARIWLGLTANCAVCHDHKFDPLSQKEFYSLSAFFNNTTQAAMDGNIKDTPPTIFVPLPEDRDRGPKIQAELADANRLLEERRQTGRGNLAKWLTATKPESLPPLVPHEGLRLYAPLGEGMGNSVRVLLDGQPQTLTVAAGITWGDGRLAAKAFQNTPGSTLEIAAAGDLDSGQVFSYGAWVRFSEKSKNGAIFARMDDQHDYRGWDLWLENGRPGAHIIHKWPEDALKVVANATLKAGEWNHLLLTYDGSRQAGGVKIYVNGKPQPTSVQANGLKGTVRTTVPLKVAQRQSSGRLEDVRIEDLRIYDRALAPSEVEQLAGASRIAALLAKAAGRRTDAETNELYAWWLSAVDKRYQELTALVATLSQQQAALQARGTVAYVMQERPGPPTAYVLFRGEYDKRREQVSSGTPAFLPPMPPELPRNRLGLARWLLRPEQPLTARVAVNRFWQELFGTGIVRTAEDFGTTGEAPSHGELLDWLAVELRDSGWDVKRLFRLLVTSAAYRQAATATAAKLEKDPQNRLLSRGPRFRMDAEMVRDYALSASGLLVAKIGGPSVRP